MLEVLVTLQCGDFMLKQSTSSKALVRFPVSHAVWIWLYLELA